MTDPSPISTRPQRARWRRALRGLGFAMLSVAVLVGCLLGGVAIYRRAFAERLIVMALELAEIELGAITVAAFEPTRLAARDLRIVSPIDVSIGGLEARYSWSSLSAERLESIDARDIRIRAVLDRGDDSGREPATGAPTQNTNAFAEETAGSLAPNGAHSAAPELEDLLTTLLAFPALPVRRIDLSNLQIEVIDAAATYEIEGELHATQMDDRLEAQARVALRGPVELTSGVSLERSSDLRFELEAKRDEMRVTLASINARIEIQAEELIAIEAETPAIAVRVATAGANAPPRIEVETEGGRVSVPTYEVEASGFTLRTAFAAGELPRTIELDVANVRDLRSHARVPPVALSARIEIREDRYGFRITLRDRDDRGELAVHGHHEIKKDRGEAEFHLKPIAFAEDGLQPTDFVRALRGSISNVTGTVEVLGSVSFAGVTGDGDAPLELHTRVDVALRDVSLTTPLSRLQAINTVIQVDGPWPPSTPPGQLLQIGLIDVGFAVTDVTASFQLNEDLTLNLEEAIFHFAGGTIRTAGLLDLAASEQALALEVSGVELEELFKLVELEGLTGSGSLSGIIPIVRRSDAIEINGGKLSNRSSDGESRTAGWIRYRPAASVGVAATSQSEFGSALEALENFHFEELDLQLSGDPNGIVVFSLHLAGANPDFHDGYPVNFNLNLEAPLASLLNAASYTQNLVGTIEQNLSAFGSKAANFPHMEASTEGENAVAAPRPDR